MTADVTVSPTYALLSHFGAASVVPTYAILSNPSSIAVQPTYVILQNTLVPRESLDILYPFVEQRFPVCVSFGSAGGPGFKTTVIEFDSGITARNIEWERLRARYTVTFENATPADIEAVENFFYGMKGRATGFRYKDWGDYQISTQNVLVGDGSTDTFQMFKRYESGGNVYDRPIKKPVAGTIQLELDGTPQVDGVDFFVNTTNGEIVFTTAPANNSIGTLVYAEFDVPVRFDTDTLNVSYDEFQQLGINSLPIIEILI